MDKFRITMPSPQSYIRSLGPISAAIFDDRGIIIDCNRQFTALFNGNFEIGKTPLSELLPDENNLETLRLRWENSQETGENVIVKANTGPAAPSEIRCSLCSAEHGERKMHILVLHDKGVAGELSLLQQFSGTFIKDVNLGVLLVDNEFRLVDVSELACSILGIDRQQSINRPMEDIFQSVPKEHQLVQRTLLDGVLVRNHGVSWTNNRERYELLMDSNLLRDEAGNVVGAYVIFKDVTNLRSLEQQVQRSDRLAMIGQIAAGTAHEIRNPLTSIKGFLQVLNRTFYQTGMEREQGYTDLMLGEIDRINELVNEFLLLSKPKNVTYDKIDMSSVIRDILPIINNQAVLHNVTIQYQSVYQIPKIVADRELLKQVFINLCKNGIEAMVQGGTLTIIERVEYRERKVHVEVHDAGPGIPAFLIDKIFDPFFTTKDSGTGLGLSVCQRIIHDIGGSIRVSSKGYGTTFTVSMPFSPS
ncbi:PAS domain-containing protein [Paenibacillus hemerocallicola]|uniref:histidine kinase n=1 Tax=Paenibacillus hemerocallicola TaxID=1172614 RepID=A0A5C4SXK1_9BACL|nr:ATP-binding protein [Paenibacillus hemerocallicola]TNJ60844.1 PAS domain-containing protein [Paenibacillus hemerocallicola]